MISQSGIVRFLLFIITISLLGISCKQLDVYEKNTAIPHYKWQHNFAANGTFIINDTSAAYNIYIVLRHTDAYMYNNIWLNVGLQAPGDSMFFQNVNLKLAADATGWDGIGMNDIWEVRKLVKQMVFKKGVYKFIITHIMRDNPLADIMSAGIRVQKVN